MGLQGREGKRGRAGRDGERGVTGSIGVKGDTGRFDREIEIYSNSSHISFRVS